MGVNHMATSIINLADLDGSNGFRMNGAAAGDFFVELSTMQEISTEMVSLT